MTIKNRIRQLEQRAEQEPPLIGGRTQAEWEWIRGERIRLLDDPKALDRIRERTMREDAEPAAGE